MLPVELAMIMDRLYGGVCYAGIDTDPELKYPKGAGRVAFSNQQSYIAAISARFVQLQHADIDKRVCLNLNYYSGPWIVVSKNWTQTATVGHLLRGIFGLGRKAKIVEERMKLHGKAFNTSTIKAFFSWNNCRIDALPDTRRK